MLSRRSFINTTLGAGVALAMPGKQQAAAQTPAAQPARRRLIVDAQVHLWKAETPDWRWVPGLPQLPEPLTIERLVPMMDEAGVDRVVVVPPIWQGDRNDYALEAARRYPDRFAVMGRIPLQDPQSAALLPRWKEQPGMLGVRLTFRRGATPWLTDGTADWFWPAAEKAGMPVMFLAAGQVPHFVPIAERHPQLTLIIDHMGLSRRHRQGQQACGGDRADGRARQISKRLRQAVVGAGLFAGAYPFRDMTVHLSAASTLSARGAAIGAPT